jgi:lysozyme
MLFVIAIAVIGFAVLRKGGGEADAAQDQTSDQGEGLGGTVASFSDALERKWEGLRLKVYQDQAGNPTIGYGHKLLPGESFPNGITQDQAAQMLQSDIAAAQAAVTEHVKVPLSTNQFSALVDWVFNLGAGKVQHSTLLQRLNAGDYSAVPSELARWKYIDGAPSDGLANRRADEIGLWNS